MASIAFSRSSESTVWFTASGCETSHTYRVQVRGSNGTWYDKTSDLFGSTSYTKSFSVDTGNSYSARLVDDTTSLTVVATGTIPAWEYDEEETVRILNYLDSSYGDLADGSYTGKIDSSFSIMASGTQYQTYVRQYDFLYYTLSSESYRYQYGTGSPITITKGLQVRVYWKSKIKPVKPTITNVSTTNTKATISWTSNGGSGSDGYWVLFYGLTQSNMAQTGHLANSKDVLITGLEPGRMYLFYIRHYISKTGEFEQSDTVTVSTKENIGFFEWTNDDANKIRAGQAVKNITASAWNNLISKVSACGGSSGSIYSASSGSRITANHFNTARNAISGLSGAGSIPSGVTAGSSKVLASLFISLKEALNRAISYKNST